MKKNFIRQLFCTISLIDLNNNTDEELNISSTNIKVKNDGRTYTYTESLQNILDTITNFINKHPYITGFLLTIIIIIIINKGYDMYTKKISESIDPNTILPSVLDDTDIINHRGHQFLSDVIVSNISIHKLIGDMYSTTCQLIEQLMINDISIEEALDFINQTKIQLDILQKATKLTPEEILHLTTKLQELINLINS
jgi:hypothetical protein